MSNTSLVPYCLTWSHGGNEGLGYRSLLILLHAHQSCCIRNRDLTCSVINGIQTSDLRNLFNPENIFISKEGGGAGNNWASGYSQGEAVQETLLDMIGEYELVTVHTRHKCENMTSIC